MARLYIDCRPSMRREEQLDEREIAGDLGSWLVRTGKATAADADRLSGKLRPRIVATAPDPEPGNDIEVEEIQESIPDSSASEP